MKSKTYKVIGTFAILFFTFGITYLDFDNLSFSNNVRPYIMLMLGILTTAFWLNIRSKSKCNGKAK
jgi:hypothetical protein